MRPLNDIGVRFTEREQQILELLVHECLSDKEIAAHLGTTEKSMKKRMQIIHYRVGIANAVERKSIRVRLARMLRPACERVPIPADLHLQFKMWDIVRLIAEGFDNIEIAEKTGANYGALKNTVHVIFNRVGVWSRLELAAWYDAHETPCEGGICVG